MNIDVTNIDETAATNRLPGRLDPCLWNEAINKNVEVWITALLELQNPDIRDGNAKFAFQVNSPLRKRRVDICDWVLVAGCLRIKRESESD